MKSLLFVSLLIFAASGAEVATYAGQCVACLSADYMYCNNTCYTFYSPECT